MDAHALHREPRPLLVLDLDGTICLGTDPARLRVRDRLDELDGLGVELHVVTNAFSEGLDDLLLKLDLADRAAGVTSDARKPAGLERWVRDRLASTGLPPTHLLAIGDIWANDIEPIRRLGCLTAHVDTWDRRPGPATLRARTLPELYPAIRAWATDPDEFAARSSAGRPDCPGTLTRAPRHPQW